MIDYLVPEFFVNPSPGGSGGMHTKVDRVRRAVGSIYRLHVGSDLSEMQSDFLLIEPLYFRMSQMFETEEDSEDLDFRGWSERYLEALSAHPATKILYCSEMEVFRWTGQFRKELLEICNAVTCNSDYQASLSSRSISLPRIDSLIRSPQTSSNHFPNGFKWWRWDAFQR